MFRWYKESTPVERNTFWGCFAGWGLDALDVQMFTLAIPAIIAAYGIGHTQAGAISSVTLISSALGGWIAGALSDRFGRVRTLQMTILWFAGFTFLCAFAQNFPQLLLLKALQGFGFGGEWAAGAVLMAETIRTEHRGRAMGAVQSAWAVGWGGAVLVYAAVFSWLPGDTAWRVMFAVGLLPAGLVLFVRRNLKEPVRVAPVGVDAHARVSALGQIVQVFQPRVLRTTLIGAVLGTGAHGGYYAIMSWLPTFPREGAASVGAEHGRLSRGRDRRVLVRLHAERVSARSHRPSTQHRVVRFLLHRHRARLRDAAVDQHADAGARLSARPLRRGHSGEPRAALQRAVSRRHARHRRRLLLQLRAHCVGGFSGAGRLHEPFDVARRGHRHRRGHRVRARDDRRAAASRNARQASARHGAGSVRRSYRCCGRD